MMSDHAVQRPDSADHLKPLYSIPSFRESRQPYQSRWMSHWMQTCSSSSSQGFKNHVVSDASNKGDHGEEQGYVPAEHMKSREAKMLSTFECITMQRSNPGELDLTSGVVRKNVFSFDSKTVLSSKSPLQQQPVSFLNRESVTTSHFMNAENLKSKWDHFPMFDINRKIERILIPKKKSGYATMSAGMSESHLPLNESTLAPHVIKFASEDQGMRPQKFTDFAGSSHSEVHRFKCHRSNMRSCICYKEGNNTFSSYKKHFASASLTHSNHELCDCRTHSTFMIPEMKNDSEMIATSFRSSWSRLKDGSVQALRDSCPGDIPFPFLDSERGKGIQTGSGGEFLPVHKSIRGSSKLDSSPCVHLLRKIPKRSRCDMEALGVCTTLNSLDDSKVGSQKFSNATQYLLITKNMGIDLSHGDQVIGESTISAEVKGTAFFQMSTLPTVSHCRGQYAANLQPPVNSRKGEDSSNGVGIDTHFMETLNESSDKTATMYINVSQIPSSAGPTSSISQKDVVRPSLMKVESTAASPIQQAFFKNATDTRNKVLGASRTESTDLDRNFSHFGKPESASIQERSNPWVKRLRHKPLDSLTLVTKRFKTGDVSYSGEAHNSFSRMFDCHESNSNASKLLEEHQESKNGCLLAKNGDCSSRESKAIHYWIRRWCHGKQQAAPRPRLMTPIFCEPNNSKVGREDFEGKHLPSMTAMALMGKAAKNFRPCKFQRKGSCLVWNIKGF